MNKHEPAFPMLLQSDYVGEPDFKKLGFTKYEQVAAMFMEALMSNPNWHSDWSPLATDAFNAADAFFSELERRGK